MKRNGLRILTVAAVLLMSGLPADAQQSVNRTVQYLSLIHI